MQLSNGKVWIVLTVKTHWGMHLFQKVIITDEKVKIVVGVMVQIPMRLLDDCYCTCGVMGKS